MIRGQFAGEGVDREKLDERLQVNALRPADTRSMCHAYELNAGHCQPCQVKCRCVANPLTNEAYLSGKGLKFIPGHEITRNLAVKVPLDWWQKRYTCQLIPDALFAIQYQKGFIACLVEADRNTEPNDPSTPHRKSARRTVKQYAEFIGGKHYKQAYGLNCPLLVLNISVSKEHNQRVLEIVNDKIGPCSYLALRTAPMFKTPFKVPGELLFNRQSIFVRNGMEPFRLMK